MSERTYGYVRVSTREQNEDRQYIAMKEYGVARSDIIMDKQSGKDFERPGWLRLKSRLRAGDVLVVESIDRLGRNYEEIKEEWRHITKDIGAYIVVLDMPLLDTRKERDLASELISDIVLELLSYVAETERHFNKKRQAEGIAAAKAKGKHLGRPAMIKPEGYEKALKEWNNKRVSATIAAKRIGVSRGTFLKWARAESK